MSDSDGFDASESEKEAIPEDVQAARQQWTEIEQQQQELQALQEELAVQFDQEQQKYNKEMRDSIQSFLREYNKSKGYSIILSKAGDNILYADPAMDITEDVVAGLNKRYKKK